MTPTTEARSSGPVRVLAPCVLLVDDDPKVLAALGRVFRDEPYQVILTSDPWQALEWLKSKNVHLLITDEFMPGLLGTDLLEAVQFHSPATATILLTGYPKPGVAYRGFQHRMDLMMPKPWEDRSLRDAALRLLREHAPRTVFKKATASDNAEGHPGEAHAS
jgi:DNA-binding NtrC family response regulator